MRVVWYVLTLVVLDLMIVDVTKEVAGTSHYNMQFQIPSLGLISMVEGWSRRNLHSSKERHLKFSCSAQPRQRGSDYEGWFPPSLVIYTKLSCRRMTPAACRRRRNASAMLLRQCIISLSTQSAEQVHVRCRNCKAADPPQSYYSLQVRLLRCQSPHSLLISVRLRNKGLIVALVLTVMTPHPVIQAVLLRIFLMQTVFIHFVWSLRTHQWFKMIDC